MDEYIFSPYSSSIEQTPLNPPVAAPQQVPFAPVPVAEVAPKEDAEVAPVAPAAKPPRNGMWMTIAIMGICISLLLGVYAIISLTRSVLEPI